MLGFKFVQRRLMPQSQPNVVQAFDQTELAERINLKARLESLAVSHRLVFKRDGELIVRNGLRVREQLGYLLFAQPRLHNYVLARVGEKDVGKCRRNHHAETEITKRPCRVFAARSAGEVLARNQNLRALVARIVEHEVRVLLTRRRAPPIEKQKLAVAGALDALQKLLGNNLVGVNIRPVQGRGQCGQCAKGFHQPRTSQLRISTKCPAMAAAAAISGDTRCVRPPRPWRSSKLRLLVEAQRSPGARMSGFMPRHIEQPGSRHSKPASRKMRSSPSFSACAFTACEPGTTIALTLVETL